MYHGHDKNIRPLQRFSRGLVKAASGLGTAAALAKAARAAMRTTLKNFMVILVATFDVSSGLKKERC